MNFNLNVLRVINSLPLMSLDEWVHCNGRRIILPGGEMIQMDVARGSGAGVGGREETTDRIRPSSLRLAYRPAAALSPLTVTTASPL